jgi:amino acid adenylation domain-containing protein
MLSDMHRDIQLDADESDGSERARAVTGQGWATARDGAAVVSGYPADPAISSAESSCYRRFAAVALARPLAPAVQAGQQTLSYAELDARAGGIAAWLHKHGAGPGEIVAILVEQSADLAAGVLGVWQAGAAYLPLDPQAPRARLRAALDELRPVAILTQGRMRHRVAAYPAPILVLDREPVTGSPPGLRAPDPDDLAYVIFTSGSTGRPKGVEVSHRALLSVLDGWIGLYRLGTEVTTVLQAAAPGFDVATGDLARALLTGCRLVTCPRETLLSPPDLHALMERTGTDYAEFTPSLLRPFVRYLAEAGLSLKFMRCLVAGGEHWTNADYQALRKVAGPGVRIFNTYGLTEAAIDSTYHETTAGTYGDDGVPIGRAVAASRLYVLDDDLRPAAEGELYVAGAQLARGYLSDPATTAQRFVPAPAGPPGARAYRTGDRVRQMPSGELTYLGRGDDQLKVRGVRIQPLEVENALRAHPLVQAAIVSPYVIGDRTELAAYVVPLGPLDRGTLYQYAAAKLPPAMVPSLIAIVDRLPVTANGKLDRARLPQPAPGEDAGNAGEAGGQAAEAAIAAIWGQVLGRPTAAVDQDFFELGGNSLLAARVVSLIRLKLGAELPIEALLECPTIAELARLVARAGVAEPIGSQPGLRQGPLSPGQNRLWVLDQMEGGLTAYNIPVMMRISGALDVGALSQSLNLLLRRHAALRTAFVMTAAGPVQHVSEPSDLELEIGQPTDAWMADFARRPFDLTRPPLIRGALMRDGDEHILALSMHHIVSDGWTVRILLHELGEIYSALAAKTEPDLAALPVSYLDYSIWYAGRLHGGDLDAQLAYWEEHLARAPVAHRLPAPVTGHGEPARQVARLGRDLTDAVRGLARDHHTTLFVTMLAAFFALLHRWSGADDMVIGTPFGDRTVPGTELLAGFFVNTLALRVAVPADATFTDLVRLTRASVMGGARAQDIPFDVVQRALRRAGAAMPFATWFNFLGEPDTAPAMAGLTTLMLRPPVVGVPFDLNVYVTELREDVEVELTFDSGRCDTAHVAAFLRQFALLLERLAVEPDLPVTRHPLNPAAAVATAAGERWSVPRVAADIIRRDPAAPAIRSASGTLTRARLGSWAADIAEKLTRLGVAADDVVAVYAHRDPSLVAALLGILEAGAAFCVLDPAYPPARSAAQMQELHPAALVHLAAAGSLPAELALLAPVIVEVGSAPRSRKSLRGTAAQGLAYVAYTSGTTGRPTPVHGDQDAVTHFLGVYASRFGIGRHDRFAMLAGLAHDPLLRDVFTPVCTGAVLCIPAPELIRAPRELLAWLAAERVTIAHVTPPLVRLLGSAAGTLPHLRLVMCGGDQLWGADVALLRDIAPQATVVNAYGTTETPQVMSWHVIGPADPVGGEPDRPIPVGHPIAGVDVLVIDAAGRATAVGEIGTVSVRTPYLTRGRSGRYDTGDLGRRMPDGCVVILGRADDEISVAGHRIRPAEIDLLVSSQPYVLDSVTVARPGPDAQQRLVTYLVPRGAPVTLQRLRNDLRFDLPEYLLPSVLVMVDRLPLSPNGKVDSAALPEPADRAAAASGAIAPRTELERQIADVWRAVLRVDAAGIDISFFDLGGTSILMAQVQQRLERALRREIPIVRLFTYPTVRTLAAFLFSPATDILDGPRAGLLPAAPDARRRRAVRRQLELQQQKASHDD